MAENQRIMKEVAADFTPQIHSPCCTLHVCTSCRAPGTPRKPKESRPGYQLFEEIKEALDESPLRDQVKVLPAECLSICPRPCGIALSGANRWTYLFGDQVPPVSVEDILECVALYIETTDGFMPRERRPKSLRGSILGRIPTPVGAVDLNS